MLGGLIAKYTVCAGWTDAPHLTPEMREKFLMEIPVNQRQARSEGIPHLGAGLVYPVSEEIIRIPDFQIPMHWKRAYALDTGWNWNAGVWGAEDPDSGVMYIYSVYKRGQVEPPIVADAVKSRGMWIPGIADAADVNRNDGKQYIEIYKNLGLDIILPQKAFETGVQQVWIRLSTSKLRIFDSCVELFDELRVYSRDATGKIPERAQDHLLDSLRYLCMGFHEVAKLPPIKRAVSIEDWYSRPGFSSDGWMA